VGGSGRNGGESTGTDGSGFIEEEGGEEVCYGLHRLVFAGWCILETVWTWVWRSASSCAYVIVVDMECGDRILRAYPGE